MPHSPEDKKRALTRLARIKGQAEVLESHLRETLGIDRAASSESETDFDATMRILRTYLK